MGRSMAAMVVTERHLWVNLAPPSGILEKKEKGFLLDAPISPSQLFGTSVETVVEKFREARVCSAAFKTFIPRRSRSEPEQSGGPGLSWSEDRRWAQKASVTTRAPPPPAGRGRGRYQSDWTYDDFRQVLYSSNCLTDGPDLRPPLRFLWEPLWSSGYSGQHCKGRASITPLTLEGYLWVCRSLRSVWISPHSEEWVLRSPELIVGRASIAPLT